MPMAMLRLMAPLYGTKLLLNLVWIDIFSIHYYTLTLMCINKKAQLSLTNPRDAWNSGHESFKGIESDTIRYLAYGLLLPSYSNFVSKMHRFRDIATYWSKIAVKPTPMSFDPFCSANPDKYLHKPYVARNYDLWSTFSPLIVWVYFHSYFCGWHRKTYVYWKIRIIAVQGQFKVIQGRWFWYQSKALMRYLISVQ